MSQELLIGAALLLIPAGVLLAVELNVARKRRMARDVARRNKSRAPRAEGDTRQQH